MTSFSDFLSSIIKEEFMIKCKQNLTNEQLKNFCNDFGITKGLTKLNKDNLIETLSNYLFEIKSENKTRLSSHQKKSYKLLKTCKYSFPNDLILPKKSINESTNKIDNTIKRKETQNNDKEVKKQKISLIKKDDSIEQVLILYTKDCEWSNQNILKSCTIEEWKKISEGFDSLAHPNTLTKTMHAELNKIEPIPMNNINKFVTSFYYFNSCNCNQIE